MRPFTPPQLPLNDLDWVSFVPLIGKANAAVARYDGLLQAIINPAILLSPLTTQEAVLSSRIEGTQATLREVLAFEAAPDVTEGRRFEDIQEIINYRSAMASAVDELNHRPLTLNLIKSMHNRLLDSVRGRHKNRGRFRSSQNYVGAPGGLDQASYVPPEPGKVMGLMENLEVYIHTVEMDQLVQAALLHAQFELIHPFLDGNGRVGRILIPLFLFEKKLLSSPMFYLSAYLEAHREEYYAGLQSISRTGDYAAWVRFFLTAVIEQARENTQKARSIHDLYGEMKQELTQMLHSQFTIQTLDTLFYQPIFSSSQFIRLSNIPDGSARRILRQLQEENILVVLEPAQGRRPAILMFARLIAIADS